MNHNPHMHDLARRLLRRKPVLRDFQIMHPRRDWFIGVGIAILLFTVGVLFSVYTYLTNAEVAQTISETTEEVVVYRESVVQAALERLGEREAVFMSVLGSPLVPSATTTPTNDDDTELETQNESEINQAAPLEEVEVIVPAPL